MTMDSAQAPHTGQDGGPATTVQRLDTVHPPRRVNARRGAPASPGQPRHSPAGAPLVVADALAPVVTAVTVPGLDLPVLLLLPLLALHLTLHTRRGLYRRRLSPSALLELPALFGRALILWCAAAVGLASFGPGMVPAWTVLATAVAAQTVVGCAGRSVVHRVARGLAARRTRATLIIGGGAIAQQIGAVLRAQPGYGMRPVGIVETGPTTVGDVEAPVPSTRLPVLSTPEDIGRAVIRTTVRHALFVGYGGTGPYDASLVQLLAQHGVRMWLVNPAGPAPAGVPADHIWGFAVRPLYSATAHRAQDGVKRGLDVCLALPMLLVVAPVMALCALAVRVWDGPGVLFRQERVGLDGPRLHPAEVPHLRPADEHESATRWSVAGDHRMSPVGSLLRRTSLDELPQLWNVCAVT